MIVNYLRSNPVDCVFGEVILIIVQKQLILAANKNSNGLIQYLLYSADPLLDSSKVGE